MPTKSVKVSGICILGSDMRLIYSTSQIDKLSSLPLEQRQQALGKACQRLKQPETFLLNIIKLAILIPFFALLVNAPEKPVNALWAAGLLLLFPLLVRPLQLGMAEKYIKLTN